MKKRSKLKTIAGIFILTYVCYILVSQQITIRNKKLQLNEHTAELKKVSDEHQQLLDEKEMSKTYRYVEKLARERLGFIKQGESVVVQEEK
jgi:cell division protein FtsB